MTLADPVVFGVTYAHSWSVHTIRAGLCVSPRSVDRGGEHRLKDSEDVVGALNFVPELPFVMLRNAAG